MSKKQRFVPGIYNYCDYWCDRCEFTRRCRNFAMGQEIEREASGDKPVDEATSAAFWNGLAEKLRETTIFGRGSEWEDEVGDDFDDGPDAEWLAKEEAHDQAVRRHELSRLADEYLRQAHAWLKAADGDLQAVARGLLDAAASPFEGEGVEEQARQIGEMIEVVAWYHTFIPAKLHRAVGGLLEREPGEAVHPVLAESRLNDANGSGKVALVAIERSIGAWLHLREILPSHESAILEMLTLLDRMRRGIHAALPGAQSFRRPGFDGEPPEEDTDEENG